MEMRFEVARVYFAQQCIFLPLPHVQVGIQNAATTSEKTKDPCLYKGNTGSRTLVIVQELCESRGGRPGLSVLMSLLVSVDVKNY